VIGSRINGLARSQEMYAEAEKYTPGGVHSNVRLGMKPFPLFFKRAEGAYLWDVDGNQYIDYAMGMGPVILGHAHPEVNQAVSRSLADGQLYAGQHEDEVRLAQTLCKTIPHAEMIRLSLSGSESVQAGIRVARAATERQKIIKFEGHYHGWFDNVDVSVHPSTARMGSPTEPHSLPESLGQPEESFSSVITMPWNNLELLSARLEREHSHIAAIIMEPVMCNTSVILPRAGFLEGVRELCSRLGIVLIFDEVVTGFRVALEGAGSLLNVAPDLTIFAKAMGNGYPVSCLAGRKTLMERFAGGVVHAGTYNSNRVSCAAALATLDVMHSNGGQVHAKISATGSALMNGFRKIIAETGVPMLVQGLPSVFHSTFTDQPDITSYRSYARCDLSLQTQFVALLRERGISITGRGTWFLSSAHTLRDIEKTLEVIEEVLLLPQFRGAPLTGTARDSRSA
jgi:glutamate-1-semialdehyde 2,1-aminomutase